ncbi:MAG TPA: tetratricopeptide repeat protein [Geobacteraceae bacterium]
MDLQTSSPPAKDSAALRDHRLWLICLGLLLAVAALFGPVAGHQFVSYDDRVYLTENWVVRGGLSLDAIRWAFTTTRDANWFPLTWLSHLLDVTLFGSNPAGHHLMNVAIHGFTTVLLFLFWARATGSVWPSALLAALFALHPLRVESVAWAAERKDVLAALFWLLTMHAYLRYSRSPGTGRYLAVVVLFALGLMCKPMLVTLPFVLLLCDWWPLQRFRPVAGATACAAPSSVGWLLLEKLPLVLLAIGSSIVTYLVQQKGGAVTSLARVPFVSCFANAVVSYGVYLRQLLWPSGLAVFYPFDHQLPGWQVALAGSFLLAITMLLLRQWRQRPWLAMGWLWYLGTLVPVIGLVRIGAQSHADRYTYLPSVGALLILVWGGQELCGRLGRRWLTVSLAAGALIACGLLTFLQLRHWQDTTTLFRRAVAVTSGNWLAHNNLAAELIRQGELGEAMWHLEQALASRPDYDSAYTNLGIAYINLRQPDQAVGAFRTALRLNPKETTALYRLAMTLARQGDLAGAREAYGRLLPLDPAQAARLVPVLTPAAGK